MKNRTGFTLVEILVVIAILGILAGFVFSVGGSVILKSQVKGTQGTILALIAACEQYNTVFGEYPNLDYPGDCPNALIGSKTYINMGGSSVNPVTQSPYTNKYTTANYQEFNKRLRYILEERMYELNEVEYGPFITQSLPKTVDTSDNSENRFMYVDAWGNFLHICPGRDHRLDTPKGPNNLSAKSTSPEPKYRRDYPLDIFSLGPNAENNVDENSGSNMLKTVFDTTIAGSDDIVSWFIDARYTEQNYGSDK